METSPANQQRVRTLLDKGVAMPDPDSVYIAPDVNPQRIIGEGVTIHPGCRIRGSRTVISAGVSLGAEGPVTLDECWLGPHVALLGGFFTTSVYLEKASMGLGAHVRAGTLLEEEANAAHTVGLKQTILFPFATLGSLINFCDCLLAGGTSRKNHSEVGSSYIHFNFTPDGDKSTASLFGDVPRGVMLNQPPIFLGGQGGAVGPLRVGYGTVVGAGSILRDDVRQDNRLVIAAPPAAVDRPLNRHSYCKLAPLVEKNLTYLANLSALQAWYQHVRRPFFEAQELGLLVYEGALHMLELARTERATRLRAMVGSVAPQDAGRVALVEHIDEMLSVFSAPPLQPDEAFLDAFASSADVSAGYLNSVQALPTETMRAGVAWLQSIVDDQCTRAAECASALALFTS